MNKNIDIMRLSYYDISHKISKNDDRESIRSRKTTASRGQCEPDVSKERGRSLCSCETECAEKVSRAGDDRYMVTV